MSLSTTAVSAGRVLFLQILFLFLCVATPRALAGDAARSPAENLRQLQALRAGYLYEELNWTVNAEFVPKPVRAKLTRLKHDLRDRIVAAMEQDADAEARPDAIKEAITLRFKKDGLTEHGREDYLRYARRFRVHAAEPPGHPELRTVILEIGIPVGYDSSLYIFSRRASGWGLVLSSEVNGYASVQEAQAFFGYKVSPSAADGSWFVVTGSVNNYAVSAWQGLTYTAQVPSDDPERPRVMVREHHKICLFDFLGHEDKAFELAPSVGEFRVSFPHEFAHEHGIAWVVDRFRIEDGRARKISRECHFNRARGRRIRCP